MKAQDDIVRFMERARGDPRIGPLHISLYLAIFYYSMRQDSEGPVMCSAKDLVALAKITGGTPYYRRMKQLHRYGYIVYEPSYNPAVKSRVSLVWDGGKA